MKLHGDACCLVWLWYFIFWMWKPFFEEKNNNKIAEEKIKWNSFFSPLFHFLMKKTFLNDFFHAYDVNWEKSTQTIKKLIFAG